jgi:DNA-binding NtrC family response regulator
MVSELFGHEKGAFTDARRAHPGLVAQAAGGTLFLDEIDNLSPRGQAALLRFMQEKEYRPLGSEQVHRSDVRVLCATNQDLAALVKAGRFREDLYYRLHVLTLKVPPLRSRAGDVALLVRHFLDKFSKQYRCGERDIHPETLAWMERHPWPGNVRELENRVHRMFVLTTGPVICLPDEVAVPPPSAEQGGHPFDRHLGQRLTQAKSRLLAEFEGAYLRRLMSAAAGNVSVAARRAGKERRALGRLLKKHGIDRQDYSRISDKP